MFIHFLTNLVGHKKTSVSLFTEQLNLWNKFGGIKRDWILYVTVPILTYHIFFYTFFDELQSVIYNNKKYFFW